MTLACLAGGPGVIQWHQPAILQDQAADLGNDHLQVWGAGHHPARPDKGLGGRCRYALPALLLACSWTIEIDVRAFQALMTVSLFILVYAIDGYLLMQVGCGILSI